MTDTFTIQFDLRHYAPALEQHPLVLHKELSQNIEHQRFADMLLEMRESTLEAEKLSTADLEDISRVTDPELRGMILSGIGYIHSFYGDFNKAFSAFDSAINWVHTPFAQAFVYTNIADLLRRLDYVHDAIRILENAKEIVHSNERMFWRIQRQIGLCYKHAGKYDQALQILSQVIAAYHKQKRMYRIARIQRHLGHIYLYKKKYQSSHYYFQQALDYADANSLSQFRYEILSDIGWLHYVQNDIQQAISLYKDLMQKELTPYQKSLALQNLAVIFYQQGDHRKTILYHRRSLPINKKYGIRDFLIEDYYRLAQCYQALHNPDQAWIQYKAGFAIVRKELTLGIQLKGYRAKLLDRYIAFLESGQGVLDQIEPKKSFEFSIDKPLTEIRNIFHSAFFNYHLQRYHSIAEMCSVLDMDPRTYFYQQKKLGLQRGAADYSHYHQQLEPYLSSLKSLTWKETNAKFEDDLYSFLLTYYQHNKQKLSDVLQISYQRVMQKTKGM